MRVASLCALLFTAGLGACSGGVSSSSDLGARNVPDASLRLDTGVVRAEDAAVPDAGFEDDAATAPDAAESSDAAPSDSGVEPADSGPADSGAGLDAAIAPDAAPADAGLPSCTFGGAMTGALDPRRGLAASRLAELEACLASNPGSAAALADGFLSELAAAGGGAPWENGESLVFFRGDASNLTVSGSFDGWPDPGIRTFRNLAGTDLHVARIPVASGAREQYKLTRRNGGTTEWFTDPLNRWVVWDGFDQQSPGNFNNELFGPSHTFGTSVLHRFFIRDRDVFLQLPLAHFSGTATMGVLYVHDGNEMLTRAGMQAIVDQAIASGNTAPIAVAWVALPDQSIRTAEYTFGTAGANGPAYVDYLATQVVPAIEAHVRVAAMPQNRGLAGASLGGLISLYGAWIRPDVFRKVGSQSGSFFWEGEDLTNQIRDGAVQPLMIYLDSGCNTNASQQCTGGDNWSVNVTLAGVLSQRGYTHLHVVDPGAQHEWSAWGRRFPQLLDFLY